MVRSPEFGGGWCVPGSPEMSCWMLVPLDPGGEWQGTARLPAGVPAQGGGPGRTDRSHGTHTAIAQRPSPSSSSTSRYDSPKRRYQRVARTMTSGGKRKPGEDRPCSGSGTEATRSHTGSLAARTHDHRRRNSVHTVAHWRRRFRACDRRAWAGRHHPVRRCVHQQPKVAAREHGEAGRGMQLDGEAETFGVERDRRHRRRPRCSGR
jgi:hypothetical protein